MLYWSNFSLSAKWKMILPVCLFLVIFVGLRWVKLSETLLFFNDMGRDYLVLLNWWESGKPPLLGPQTSVVSYNQSAWYFYFLFPLFVLSHFSAVSSTATITIFGVLSILVILWFLRKNSSLFWTVLSIAFLLSAHPQMIIQNRFVWNPSFVPYFFLFSLIATIQLAKKYSIKLSVLFWLSIAFAVGFSYSSVPLAICLIIYVLFKHRKHWWKQLLIALSSACFVLLPTILFEMRHGFALTKLFLKGQSTPQEIYPVLVRSQQLAKLVLPAQDLWQTYVISLVVLIVIIVGVYYAHQKSYKNLSTLKTMTALFSILLLLQIILPINIEKHYIFPLLIVLFATIASLPTRFRVGLVSFLVLFWLQPFFLDQYTKPPVRSITDMEGCYQQFCANNAEPYYVSMESGILVGYHNAPEHQFFLRKAGCAVKDIEQSQNEANHMLVINDNGKFDPGKSGYRELSLFGNYILGQTKQCSPNLSIQEIVRPSGELSEEVFTPQ